jgi:predicted ATPase/DNA-binding SARP family transcriptional activator
VWITTLGSLTVDGKPVGGQRLAVVVRELVAARGRAVSTAALAGAVWPEDPPQDAVAAVQALIARVRRLGVPVVTAPGGYRTPADEVETDVAAAEALAGRSRAALRAGDHAAARSAADEARAFFPAVPDLTDTAAARLFSDIVSARAECALAGTGSYGEDDLRRLVTRRPPDEPAAALLVRVLADQGRDAEAQDVVAQLRADLVDTYGADPSPVVTGAHLALLRGELPVSPSRRTPRSALPASWQRARGTLVGRESDVAAVLAALAEAPLVTVVAGGGAGKTRLAAEVTRRTTGAVWVVELAGLRTPEEVAPAVLAALGGGDAGRVVRSSRHRLREAAAGLTGLVVLDNCEHLLDAAAAVTADLLDATPDVVVLATSRAPLGLLGETVHRLTALSDADARALLETRARQGGTAPAWDSERALRLCHRLDNLPLALELAAARLRHMPIDDVLAGLGDRFALLDDALRGLPERHASLWAMVDWSRDLLEPDDQELLQRLAVLPVPFTAATAAAVAGRADVRGGLAALVEQSLLVLEAGDRPPRYRMLETVREYGEARLADRGPALTGLLSWARPTANELSGDLVGPRQLETLGAVARDQENLLAALRWALETGDEPAAVDLAAVLILPLTVRGLSLEVDALAEALLHPDDLTGRRRSALSRGEGADADRIARVSLLIAMSAGITGRVRLAAVAVRVLRTVLRTRPGEVSPRHAALAGLVTLLHGPRSERARAGLAGLIADDDPYVRGMGLFARCAVNEMIGGPGSADDARAAYRCFEVAGDHWGMGMAAQAVAHATAGSDVGWLTRGVRHMDLIGAAQEARSARVQLDTRLAIAGDADAERRLHDTMETQPGQDWDRAQACLALAGLAWQRDDRAALAREAGRLARATRDVPDPQPHQRVLFRVAAAILHLASAAGRPSPSAEAAAAALLTQVGDEITGEPDGPLPAAWAIGGALLARQRGDEAGARILWALGGPTGDVLTAMFPPGEFARLTAPLGPGDAATASAAGSAVRIRELMTQLL